MRSPAIFDPSETSGLYTHAIDVVPDGPAIGSGMCGCHYKKSRTRQLQNEPGLPNEAHLSTERQ
jgi:hypothetical protein